MSYSNQRHKKSNSILYFQPFKISKPFTIEAHFHQINLFIQFPSLIPETEVPLNFQDPFALVPHPLAVVAARHLQEHLLEQANWEHNFGLEERQTGNIIGKMFGVLVVKTAQNAIGYLAGYSGKLAGGYHQPGFVPPVFDGLTPGSFLNIGMAELSRINLEIETLQMSDLPEKQSLIFNLKQARKENSVAIQDWIFDNYLFLNRSGDHKNMRDIFMQYRLTKPPSGAGECAAPRLLQYAFQHSLIPLALAEFWWGQSPKSDFWKHRQFYPACREKCEPILAFMLGGNP